MSRSSWLIAASLLALSACAGTPREGTAMTAAPRASASTATPMPTNPPPQAQPTAPAPQAQATPAPGTAQPTTFTDAQLRSFAAAATAIQPLNAQLQTATPEQRTTIIAQIRATLTQNNLDGATYNAIAAQAQADPALAARISALGSGATAPG